MEDRIEYYECACFSTEHTLKFYLLDDPEIGPELHTSIFLNQYHNIFGRIWIAIKYIFGYKCKYGHWDCWILQKEDAERLSVLMDDYKRYLAEFQEKQRE